MKLSELKAGQQGVIVKVHGHGAFRKRVIEMGFVAGRPVTMVIDAPLRDPIKYNVMGYEVSLRASEADLIEVVHISGEEAAVMGENAMRATHPELANHHAIEEAHHRRRIINIALIGNPNCGKTSLFNIASGSKEHVGNYSGVTVDAKDGHFKFKEYSFRIIDLPGTYSLSCYSPEEVYVRQYLSSESPDVIVNVVDSSNLERNLFLRASGASLDYAQLGGMIGVPMVPVVARTGEGFADLFDTVINVYENRDTTVRHVHVNLGADLESAIRQIVDMLKSTPTLARHFSPRYLAIKLLEGGEAPGHAHRRRKGFLSRLFPKGCCKGSSALPSFTDDSWKQHIRQGAGNPVLMLRDKLRAHIETLHNEILCHNVFHFLAHLFGGSVSYGLD